MNLHARQIGTRLFVGPRFSSVPDAVKVNVWDLPLKGVIKVSLVNEKMMLIDKAWSEGKTVLVRCEAGICRSPSIAYLYAIGKGLRANMAGSHPNADWRNFIKEYYQYYKKRRWVED